MFGISIRANPAGGWNISAPIGATCTAVATSRERCPSGVALSPRSTNPSSVTQPAPLRSPALSHTVHRNPAIVSVPRRTNFCPSAMSNAPCCPGGIARSR